MWTPSWSVWGTSRRRRRRRRPPSRSRGARPAAATRAEGGMALLTLAEAKAQLDITTDTEDDELQAYIDALTAPIERHVGPVENRTVTEIAQGRGTALALSQAPVVSLTSLTPRLAGGTAIGVDEVFLDGDSGTVYRVDGGSFVGG